MSYFVGMPREVLDTLAHDPRLIQVWLVLASYADTDGTCYPHQETLAEDCACSVSTIKRAVSDMVDLGVLNVTNTLAGNSYSLPRWNVPQLTSEPSNSSPVSPTVGTRTSELDKPLADSKNRPKRDEVFDAVCAVCNIDVENLTSTGRGPLNRAVKELKAVGATEADVFYAGGAYGRKFPQAALTPMALAKNWAQLQPVVLREIRPGAMSESRVEQEPGVTGVLSDEELAANQERIRALREGLRGRRHD